MSDDEILEKVKIGLKADDSDYNDSELLIKTIAVKQYMLNAGITQIALESELGIATLTIGVNDIWSLESGEIKFSFAFDMCLMPQLKAISI
ncbi:phage gp6-like head-tail connector protein [Clostridium beijerinckii]|uniref:phage gp6-like head-tail connector protein n=1 Tax=Clostridium beijerinckii TaxID=1520 RepID=UPI00149426CA|nr:phage gp6-like head-tail connector protein [Clostridium beijerinckii]NOW07852.1 hypothetical protein [Clostridium beijerinckii]NYC05483.1 hypothetical protein [Clostridium beijerinckii]